MVGISETKALVSTLLRSRSAVADAARAPDQQRLIGPILAEIDRAVAALDPNTSAAVPLTTLNETAKVPDTDVEALRREVERLRAVAMSERGLLEAVLTHSPHGIIVSDAQGRIFLQNRAAEKIWSGSATTNNVEGWGQYRAFHADGRPYEPGDWSMARALSKGETVDAEEVHFQRFDGSHGILLGSAAPVFGPNGEVTGAVSIFADITHFKRLEQALRMVEEQRRFIGDASFFLTSLALDYEGTVAAVAGTAVPRLADWCFVDLVELDGSIGRAAVAHVDPDRAQLARELRYQKPVPPLNGVIQRVIKSGQPESTTEVIQQMVTAASSAPEYVELLSRLDGTSSMTVPLWARGRTLGALTFVCAESERRFGTDDLSLAKNFGNCAGLALDNARLYREAQRVNRIKDEFLANLSHELRTPLNAVLGWSRLLRTGKLDEKGRVRALETIERNAQSQTQLIEDLLDVSRIISGKFCVDVRPVNLPAVIDAAIDSVRLAADARGIELRTSIDKVAEIMGDPTRLQQMVWNLLSNAIKFTPRGGHVDVMLRQVESHMEIEVSDDGQGIPVDFLPFVFDRFRQADGSTTRPHNGLGLGLNIVRHLSEIHGGSVRAKSGGVGHGASFTVKLPIAAVRLRALAAEGNDLKNGDPTGLEQPPPLHGVRVLVVDDESDARELVTMVLTEQGAGVIAVGSVPEALQAIELHKPDVLVSDIGMPCEDGYTLIRRVKAMEKRVGRIPAAALTAYAGVQDRTRALLAGYSSHLPKPIEPAELAAVVANLAGRTART
jgi:PAS domain S-box-containing protein